jgi:isopenicillin N synthase-like dioxygenase
VAIPTISLADWTSTDDETARRAFAERMCTAGHEIGFVLLTHTDLGGVGVDAAFLDRWFAGAATFFALPESVKAQIDKAHSPHFRGWERVGAELTDNRVDHREQLDLSTEHPARAHDATPLPLRLDGPNQWLPDVALPGFHALADEFFTRMGAVATEVMRALSLGLGLGEDDLLARLGERPTSFVKMISYPRTPPGEAGVNAHHDAGFVTLLAQHEVGGLQVLAADQSWIDVPPERGTLVMNLGENLQSMTGNYLVATTHRVITNEARLSSAFFQGADVRMALDPLPLDGRFADAVAASPRHAGAGFMARRDDLLAGQAGTVAPPPATYGEQLWNYYVRSYPEHVRRHHPDAQVTTPVP